jgi:hypothetical protein
MTSLSQKIRIYHNLGNESLRNSRIWLIICLKKMDPSEVWKIDSEVVNCLVKSWLSNVKDTNKLIANIKFYDSAVVLTTYVAESYLSGVMTPMSHTE